MSRRILVVDDSPAFRRSAVELLHAQGLSLFAAVEDGEAACQALTEQRPDGVLLDINLPGQDGVDVAATLTNRYPELRVVLTSSDVDDVPADVLAGSGAVAFVPKTELVAADLARLFS
jgi:CheY-like chemotaxis protein